MRVDVFCNNAAWKGWLQQLVKEGLEEVSFKFRPLGRGTALVDLGQDNKPDIVVVYPSQEHEFDPAIAAIQQLRRDYPAVAVIGVGTYGSSGRLVPAGCHHVTGSATPDQTAGLIRFYWLGTKNPA